VGTVDTPPGGRGTVDDLPHPLLAALKNPTPARRGWQSSLAPNLIGLFLWVAFFDQIPRETLALGGVLWPVLGAGLGGLLCYLFLYHTPAEWGVATGRPLAVLATSTFGVEGATWVPGVLLALAQVAWLAVSTLYGTTLTLRGLVLLQLLDPKLLHVWVVGGWTLPGPLFLVASLAWCLQAAFVGRYLVRVIAALMNVYPALPALMLGLTTLLAFKGLRGFQAGTGGGGAAESAGGLPLPLFVMLLTVQTVFGFFATAGLLSADWGAVTRDAGDVRRGGWVGVVFAPWVVATLAILTVAGAGGQRVARGPLATEAVRAIPYTAALETLVSGRAAGSMLVAFGLAALAPACYAAFFFSTRMNDTFPSVGKTRWTLALVAAGWLLLVSGGVGRTLDVFNVVGGLLAPVAGALAGDRVRAGGVWPGPRRGFNPPGWVAWVCGSALGLAPVAGRLGGFPAVASLQPAAVYGFLLAFLVYVLTAAVVGESPPDPRVAEAEADAAAMAEGEALPA